LLAVPKALTPPGIPAEERSDEGVLEASLRDSPPEENRAAKLPAEAIPETVREVLAQLREALENEEEIRPIDTLLITLKGMELSTPLQQVAAAISDSVLLSEFSGAKDIIDNLLS
jgi:predicted HAD superfamily phosphohydrolase